MMLAAWNEDIGSCPAHLPEGTLARLLGVPEGVLVNRVAALGYVDPEHAAPPASVPAAPPALGGDDSPGTVV